jgi:uncharacterized protein YndB with AHSA1/START domain
MKTIKQTYVIKASLGAVWHALVDAHTIEQWGGGSAKMDDKKGTKFSRLFFLLDSAPVSMI